MDHHNIITGAYKHTFSVFQIPTMTVGRKRARRTRAARAVPLQGVRRGFATSCRGVRWIGPGPRAVAQGPHYCSRRRRHQDGQSSSTPMASRSDRVPYREPTFPSRTHIPFSRTSRVPAATRRAYRRSVAVQERTDDSSLDTLVLLQLSTTPAMCLAPISPRSPPCCRLVQVSRRHRRSAVDARLRVINPAAGNARSSYHCCPRSPRVISAPGVAWNSRPLDPIARTASPIGICSDFPYKKPGFWRDKSRYLGYDPDKSRNLSAGR